MTCKASLLRMAEAASPEARHDIYLRRRSDQVVVRRRIPSERIG